MKTTTDARNTMKTITIDRSKVRNFWRKAEKVLGIETANRILIEAKECKGKVTITLSHKEHEVLSSKEGAQ